MDKKRLQKLAGILKEENGEGDFSPTTSGYYWFKELPANTLPGREPPSWEIVFFEEGQIERVASDEFRNVFQGTKDEYLAMGNAARSRGNFILGVVCGTSSATSMISY